MLFMTAFYTRIIQGPPKADALRGAQDEVRQK